MQNKCLLKGFSRVDRRAKNKDCRSTLNKCLFVVFLIHPMIYQKSASTITFYRLFIKKSVEND